MTSSDQELPLPADFLALLACPVCDDRAALEVADDHQHLVCSACQRRYPVRDGIADLTAESAVLPD